MKLKWKAGPPPRVCGLYLLQQLSGIVVGEVSWADDPTDPDENESCLYLEVFSVAGSAWYLMDCLPADFSLRHYGPIPGAPTSVFPRKSVKRRKTRAAAR